MSAVLFAAHNDDETLWTFYNLLRHRPKVIIVLRSLKEWTQGGPGYREREKETACAMNVAGVEWEQWPFLDVDPDWAGISNRIFDEIDAITVPDEDRDTDAEESGVVIGPAWERGGHEHHNEIARAIDRAMPVHEIRYLSYVRGHGRSESPNEVVPTAEERMLKLVALQCYPSQAKFPPTAPWFGGDQREFVL